ncbi:MAG: YcxB family protein [Deferribacteraceae bacterium]|jgi:hypothetical protein|nr:YcxB family protein [Deferribacteraceae bacterium]
MILHYNVTKEDYEKAVIAYIDRHAGKMRLFSPALFGTSVVLILLALFTFLNYTNRLMAWPIAIWAVFCFIFAMFNNSKFKGSRFVQTRIKAGAIPQGYFGTQSIELKEDSLLLSYGTVSDRPYNTIGRVEDYPDAVLLFGTGAALDIIPAKAFGNSGERSNFINALNEKISMAREKAINSEQVAKSCAEARLVLEYSYDEAELIAAISAGNHVFVRTSLFMTPMRIFMLLLGIGLMGLSIYMLVQGIGYATISLVVMYLGALMLLPIRLLFMPFIRRAVTKTLRNGGLPNDSTGPQVLCFMENGLRSFTRLSSYELSYDQLFVIKQTDEYLVLLSKLRTVHVFPLAAFGSAAAVSDFVKFLSSKVDIKI